jgi:hypothetical protein
VNGYGGRVLLAAKLPAADDCFLRDILGVLLAFHAGERHNVDTLLIRANQLTVEFGISGRNIGDQLRFGILPKDSEAGS